MPTVFRWKGYRFFWYQADGNEPPHVHVGKDGKECKIWLVSGEVAFNKGHAAADMRALQSVLLDHREQLLETWHEHFGR